MGPAPGRLDFTLGGHAYSFRAKDVPTWLVEDEDHLVELELWSGGSLLFAERATFKFDRSGETCTSSWMTAFVEGDWIDDFRALEREVVATQERNRGRLHEEHIAREAERLGLSASRANDQGRPARFGRFLSTLLRKLLRPARG